jgi:hypothetical protein
MTPDGTPREKKRILAVIIVLLASAVVVLAGLRRLPFPARLALATLDLIVAAVLAVFLRQRFPKR